MRRAPAAAGIAASERRRRLLALVREAGRIEVAAGAEALSVSVETVRRDLNVLQEHRLLRREYGVAFPVDSRGFESDLTQRQTAHLAEKRRIAAEAARHLDDAETVFVDEGSLPEMVARELPADRELTVVTASLSVAVLLAPRRSTTVIMVGGRMRAKTLAAVDHWATAMLAQFVIDVAFLGANGISRAEGLTTPDPQVADVKAAAVRVSRRRIFVGAHVRFGVATFCRFAEVKDFDTVITDTGLSGAEGPALPAGRADGHPGLTSGTDRAHRVGWFGRGSWRSLTSLGGSGGGHRAQTGGIPPAAPLAPRRGRS